MATMPTSLQAMFHVSLEYSSKLCQIIFCVFSTSHLVFLNAKLFLSTQMIHNKMPLNSNPILKNLLNEEGIFFSKISCCQSSGPQGHFCCFHCIDISDRIIPICASTPRFPKIYARWFLGCLPCTCEFYHQNLQKYWLCTSCSQSFCSKLTKWKHLPFDCKFYPKHFPILIWIQVPFSNDWLGGKMGFFFTKGDF